MDRRDTCLKVDELYKCRTMFGRNVTCITGLTDQGNQNHGQVCRLLVTKVQGIFSLTMQRTNKMNPTFGTSSGGPAWHDILVAEDDDKIGFDTGYGLAT